MKGKVTIAGNGAVGFVSMYDEYLVEFSGNYSVDTHYTGVREYRASGGEPIYTNPPTDRLKHLGYTALVKVEIID